MSGIADKVKQEGMKLGIKAVSKVLESPERHHDPLNVDRAALLQLDHLLSQLGDVFPHLAVQHPSIDTGVINWINADLVTHICPRV